MTDSQIDAYVESHQAEILEELITFCKQPSVSAENLGIAEMLALTRSALERRGFTVEVIETGGSPLIIAEAKGIADRSILFYNHYDVQPPEPLEAWTTPPFEPTIRDGKLFARGVMDDKGHIVCRLAAIDAVRAVYGDLPCTLKFLIEGEEETNSPHLPDMVRKHADRLKSDLCVWEFGDVTDNGQPMLYLGFRGILYLEMNLRTASADAHSGVWGNITPNPAWRLNWALSSMKDPSGNILIPGFYDDVIPPSERDLELLAQLPMITPAELRQAGIYQFLQPFANPTELYQAAIFQPSFTICGLTAGYQGSGPKTITPAWARAKMDFRLAPNQTPQDIAQKVRQHLDANGFADIELSILGSENPARTPTDHLLVQEVVEAAAGVYDLPQLIQPMSGGSGPAHVFVDALNVPIVTVGVGYPGSRIHAPDENIRLDDLYRGIRHTARLITRMA